MTTRQTTVAKARWRDWYRNRGREYNRKRKERYASDPEYRHKARKRARDYKRKKFGRLGKGQVLRELAGKPVVCVRVGTVAKAADVSPALISKLHRQGAIPETLFEGYRLYTANQVELLVEFLGGWVKLKTNKERNELIEKWKPVFNKSWGV